MLNDKDRLSISNTKFIIANKVPKNIGHSLLGY